MTISAVGESPDAQEPTWQQTGDCILGLASIFAGISFYHGVTQKRRTYTVIIPSIGQGALSAEASPLPTAEVPQATAEERSKIQEMFKTIASEGVFGLAFSATKLTRWGNEIEHVHPFTLLKTVRKGDMSAILQENSTFKIHSVINGIEKGIRRECSQNNLTRYLDAFGRDMGKCARKIAQLIEDKNILGLTRYLYQ